MNVSLSAAEERLAEVAIELGCDRVGFMPVHLYDFMDGALESENPDWLDEVQAVIGRLKGNRKKYRLDSSDEYLDRFITQFRGQESELHCYAGHYSLTVDPYGDFFPCDPYIEWKRPIGNLETHSVREFWWSETANEARRETAACRRCHWNCTTELNQVFNRIGVRGGSRTQSTPR